MEIYDVLIIGSGPAGVAAALTCKKAGLKVCVISKKIDSPGNDPTVQSVHPGVLTVLTDLGLTDVIQNSSTSTFSSIQVNGEVNRLSSEKEEWFGHHVNRSKFNKELIKGLKIFNIKVVDRQLSASDISITKSMVTIKNNHDHFLKGKFCIDASGYKRLLKSFINARDKIYSRPLHCRTGVSKIRSHDKRHTIRTKFTSLKNGWFWIAPHNNDEFTWTWLTSNRREFTKLLSDVDIMTNKAAVYNSRWRLSRPICDFNILLCGDSGGILDPAAGQGILNALMSGIMVGECLYKSVKQPILKDYFFVQYDQWFVNGFEEKVSSLIEHYRKIGIDIGKSFTPH